MEIDSRCLFADVNSCGEGAVPCKDLCVRTLDEPLGQNLHGCCSTIEALLFQYGKIDMPPYNLEQNHVCHKHLHLHYPSQFKNCCLCNEFGRRRPSSSGLRPITKLYAFAAWKVNGLQTSFGKLMCTQCRNHLERSVITEQMRDDCDNYFSWLYDVRIVHTPSISTPDSFHPLSQSIQAFIDEEKKERLKDFLHGKLLHLNTIVFSNEDDYSRPGTGYLDHVPAVSSFVNLQPSSQKRFSRQMQGIFKSILGILVPNDDVDNVWECFIKNCNQKLPLHDGCDKQSQLVLSSLSEAYGNAHHWTVRRQILSIMAKDHLQHHQQIYSWYNGIPIPYGSSSC